MSGPPPRTRSSAAAAGEPRDRCLRCGHLLLDRRRRCPECGFAQALSAVRGRPPQLATFGPRVLWPIACRFAAMGVIAAIGPVLAIVLVAVLPLLGLASVPQLRMVVSVVAIPLPIAVALSLPYGPGSLGGANAPVQIASVRLGPLRLHDLAAICSISWWLLSLALWLPLSAGAQWSLLITALIGACAGTFLHLHWLAQLGESVCDDGPQRLLSFCVGAGIVLAILASMVAALQDVRWPFEVGLLLFFLITLLAQIVGPMLLARDMIYTLVGAYEEMGRAQRRARRAQEDGPQPPT